MDFFENLASMELSVWDILDILIIWFIIYSLFRFLRGRRTMQMALGLFALFMAKILSEILNLVVVNQIISTLMNLIPVAVIVLFQDEIRRLLASLGNTSFFTREDPTNLTILENVFGAALVLAREYTGALMVLQREQGLANYTETGTRLDALVSNDLLVDLFNRGSNLHDGAVIIAAERIAAAACILPLSRSQSIPKHYGTRHRAAIGLSEETDAIVIVVSEETGKISFARGGEIFTLREASLPILLQTYNNLLLPEDDARAESIRVLTKKPLRKRRHGKVKKKFGKDELPTGEIAIPDSPREEKHDGTDAEKDRETRKEKEKEAVE